MSFPNLAFWWRLLATLGVEVCVLAALGFAAQFFVRPASGRRAIWQITLVCLLLLPLSEWTGLGRGAADFLLAKSRLWKAPRCPGSWPSNLSFARLPLPPPNLRTAAPTPAVWWPGCLWLAGAGIVLARVAAARVLLLLLRLRRHKITTGPSLERITLSLPACRPGAQGLHVLDARINESDGLWCFPAQHRSAPGVSGQVQCDGTGRGSGA